MRNVPEAKTIPTRTMSSTGKKKEEGRIGFNFVAVKMSARVSSCFIVCGVWVYLYRVTRFTAEEEKVKFNFLKKSILKNL